jgi:hypothetical protein
MVESSKLSNLQGLDRVDYFIAKSDREMLDG